MWKNLAAWGLFVFAALLEVGGDAVVRRGLRGGRAWFIAAGCLALAAYGIIVNLQNWDFSKLIGVYIGFFALISVLCGWLVFGEKIPVSTWLGLGLVVAGSLVIQFGRH